MCMPERGALTYVRESCEPEDADRRFYLHVYPVDAGLLSGLEAELGYKNRDFGFWEQGRVDIRWEVHGDGYAARV